MKRVLFVDDQPELLDGLKRMLRSRRAEWQMRFALSGAEALELISQEPYDVVVSDMRMPGMDGDELLDEVMRRSPRTVRIMLSGHADQEQILRATGPTHQFLSKPCPPDALASAITHACALRDFFHDSKLQEMVSKATRLPSIPAVYQDLMEALRLPEVSVKTIGEIVSKDLGLTCRLLHLVNSGFFALPRRVDNPAHAASLLGLDRLRPLILSAGVFTNFQGRMPPGLSLNALMQHSLATSVAAHRLAELERPGEIKLANDAAFAGIVHDVGYLIMLQNHCRDYQVLLEAVCSQHPQLGETELQQFHARHDQLGAYLIGLWGLPDEIVQAVAQHHAPVATPDRRFNVLTAVHAADALVFECRPQPEWPFGSNLRWDYLHELGLDDRVNVWRKELDALLPKGNQP